MNIKKWCHKRVEYPRKGYVVTIPLISKDDPEKEDAAVFPQLFSSLEMCVAYALDVIKISKNTTNFAGKLLICEVDFFKDWELEPTDWSGNTISYSQIQQRSDLINAFSKPHFYQLIVTIQTIGDRIVDNVFLAATAVHKGSDADVANFIRFSDWPVPPEVQNIGIYHISKVFVWDIETAGEIYTNQNRSILN
jgi:hypothetical protein